MQNAFETYEKDINTLFKDLKLTCINQGSEEWNQKRKTHLTSSDICCIIMNMTFNQPDIYVPLHKMMQNKIDPDIPSPFMRNRMKAGVISEANIISQMKRAEGVFKVVLPSQYYLGKYCSVSPDVIAVKREDETIHYVYELKYTVVKDTYEAVRDGDQTNKYFKRHMIQLAYHMLAYSYYLKKNSIKGTVVGILMVCCPYEEEKLSYAKASIDMDSLYVSSICKHIPTIIGAIEDIRDGIEPFYKNAASEDLLNDCKRYAQIKYETEILQKSIIDRMVLENIQKIPIENPIGDKMQIHNQKRKKAIKKLKDLYDKERFDLFKEKLKKLEHKIQEDFYDISIEESSSLVLRKTNR